jgi:ankyrin repeat protein
LDKIRKPGGRLPTSLEMCSPYGTENVPLITAVSKQNFEICKLLLLHGAYVNKRTKIFVITPLIEASRNGNYAICELLLRHGANVFIGDDGLRQPLYFAASHGHYYICELLLSYGELQSNSALSNQRFDYGAQINFKDCFGDTALHRAADYGYTDVCELLLNNGADVNALNESNEPPLKKALYQDHIDTAEVLLYRGANIKFIPNTHYYKKYFEDNNLLSNTNLEKIEVYKRRKIILSYIYAFDTAFTEDIYKKYVKSNKIYPKTQELNFISKKNSKCKSKTKKY